MYLHQKNKRMCTFAPERIKQVLICKWLHIAIVKS